MTIRNKIAFATFVFTVVLYVSFVVISFLQNHTLDFDNAYLDFSYHRYYHSLALVFAALIAVFLATKFNSLNWLHFFWIYIVLIIFQVYFVHKSFYYNLDYILSTEIKPKNIVSFPEDKHCRGTGYIIESDSKTDTIYYYQHRSFRTKDDYYTQEKLRNVHLYKSLIQKGYYHITFKK